jgi:cell division protein FtsZ
VFSIIDRNTPAISAFKVIDSILLEATRSISDLINNHGYINLDFADIRTVMLGMGDALMGTGMATSENRATAAAAEAISSPLLDGVDINGALGVLINITGGSNLTLWEVNEAATIIQEAAGTKVNVIFGMVVDEALSDELRVTVIATGFNKEAKIKTQLEAPKSVPKNFEPVDFSELDKPAFIRKNKDEGKVDSEIPALTNPQKTSVYSAEDEDIPEAPDELDTPTFLRKQMD